MATDFMGNEIEVAPKSMVIHAVRRDGKFPVSFVFPLSGRVIKKLLSKEALDAEIAKGHYLVCYR